MPPTAPPPMIIIPDPTQPHQRAGRKSRHPLLFVLDWLCQRCEYSSVTYLQAALCFLWVANLVWFAIHVLYWSIVPALLHIDYLYRLARHRYFARHHLPGPYGWGTLDRRPSRYYE